MKKSDLFEYLDGFSFVSFDEIQMAVNDFFVEKMYVFNPSYSDLMYYQTLASEYMLAKNYNFTN